MKAGRKARMASDLERIRPIRGNPAETAQNTDRTIGKFINSPFLEPHNLVEVLHQFMRNSGPVGIFETNRPGEVLTKRVSPADDDQV
jgi:hypothetical protein